MYMAPPFLAYYAVSTSNLSLLLETVRQCGLYREVLQLGSSIPPASTASDRLPAIYGLWRHIVGPQLPDPGLWSTGNAWSAAGMTRVLATVVKAPRSLFRTNSDTTTLSVDSSDKSQTNIRTTAINLLTTYIKEILDGVIDAPLDNGLLRNYLNDTSGIGHGFGEISGSTMLANVVYRMVILRPDVFLTQSAAATDSVNTTTNGHPRSKYLEWAEGIRHTIGSGDHVSKNGTVAPAVNPLDWGSTVPFTAGSPEGQNFAVLMYAAWRDCVLEGVCRADSN